MVSFKVTAIATQLLAPPRNATPKRAILETRFQWRNRSFSLPNYCASAPHVPICLALLRLTGEEGSELLEAQQTYFASFAGTVPKRSKTTANWYYIDRLKLYPALMYHMLADRSAKRATQVHLFIAKISVVVDAVASLRSVASSLEHNKSRKQRSHGMELTEERYFVLFPNSRQIWEARLVGEWLATP